MHTRKPVLLIVSEPWSLERAVEEVGDTLYVLDENIEIEVIAPTLALAYSRMIAPWRAIGELMRNPPAYARRIVPIESIVNANVDDVVRTVVKVIRTRGVNLEAKYNIEIHKHGFNVNQGEMERIRRRIEETLGVPDKRKKPRWSILLDFISNTRLVVSVTPYKLDRVSYWRRLKWPHVFKERL